MSYEYDGNGGLQPAPPKKNDNDLGAWIFIAVMFAVAWPVGLILLTKLSEGGKKKVRRQTARSDAAQKTVQQVTRTPEYSARSGKIMKTVGAVLGIVGALFLLRQLDFTLGYAIEYGEWMYLLRQIFYPVGMLAGGASLLLGSGVTPPAAVRHVSPHGGAEAGGAAGLSGACRRRVPPPGGEGHKRHAGKGSLGRRGLY